MRRGVGGVGDMGYARVLTLSPRPRAPVDAAVCVCLFVCFACPSFCLTAPWAVSSNLLICLATNMPACIFTYLPVYLPKSLSPYICFFLSGCLSASLSACLPVCVQSAYLLTPNFARNAMRIDLAHSI